MSDLQRKDIINMTTGTRIGKIIDIDVNEDGLINNLIVGELKMMKRFNNSSETRISFKQIKTIGSEMNKKIAIISIIVFILDQATKYIIESLINLNQSIKVIKNFFYLTYVHNEGAAWSLFLKQRIFLIVISILALYVIIKYLKNFTQNKRNMIAFGLLIGGILGNFFDRLVFGYVKDFLDFRLFNYNYPIFNISDIAIFFGVILVIYAIIKGEDHEDINK